MSGIRSLHIIVAAGSGSRFGADLPKQFCLMAGRPVIVHTIEAMRRASGPDDRIVVAISAPMIPVWEKIEVAYGPTGAAMIAAGGPTRAATVANALRATARIEADVITIHDGARPLITPAVVDRLVEAASRPGSCGAIPVVELTDSIRRLLPGGGTEAVARSGYRAVQTPQAFPAQLLRVAYDAADPSDPMLTDDASVVEVFCGEGPALVAGDPSNIKITHPTDIERAEIILGHRR